MKKSIVAIAVFASLISGCQNAESKAQKKAEHLASLTCESSRENRTKEELQAIGDSCFRRGSFTKSSGKTW